MNWKQKLSSRKLWTAIIGFITAMLVTFNVPDLTIEKVSGMITAAGMLAAYILAEGSVDGKSAAGNDSEAKGAGGGSFKDKDE